MRRLRASVLAIILGPASPALGNDVASIARGGLLYDDWAKVLGQRPPSKPHPAYPKSGAFWGKGSDYRCKECHGWDYRGKDGAYGTGAHRTGIAGIRSSAGRPTAEILAVLVDRDHRFDQLLGGTDLNHLARFVSKGQVDMDRLIDRKTRRSSGSSARGEKFFLTVCAKCHGVDGQGDANMESLGPLSRRNPWETLHKILNGAPDAEMPALRAFGLRVALDILAYAQTLPK